jgi:hypothetical protein
MEMSRKKTVADLAHLLLVVFPIVAVVWWVLVAAMKTSLPTPILMLMNYPAVRVLGVISMVVGAALAFRGKPNRNLVFLGGYALLASVVSVIGEMYMRGIDPVAPSKQSIIFVYVAGIIILGYIVSAIVLAVIWFARGRGRYIPSATT